MAKQGSPLAGKHNRRGAGAPAADPIYDLAPFIPTASNPWDVRKSLHLMRRAGFGAKPVEIPAILHLGLHRTVDLLLQASPMGLQEFGSQILPHGELLDLSELASQRAQWLYEMTNGYFPLREKMALFWHDHFSVGSGTPESEPLLPGHINTLRRHALGSFRDMLIAVTADPAMLWWLDNHLNGRTVNGQKQVNENYGRELLELYTMGVHGGYSQQDVYETSKCLSGWSLEGYNVFRYDPSMHIDGDKTVLGQTIRSGGQQEVYDLIDRVILPWPATSEYIVGKIWAYFVSAAPYPALIAELARRFRQDGFNIRSLMSTILRCNYFYSDQSIGVLIKNPVEFAVGSLRNAGTPITSFKGLGAQVAGMGYPLLRYANPAGLQDGMAWINTTSITARGNFANELTRLSTTAVLQNRFDPWQEISRVGLRTAEEIVDYYLTICLGGTAPDSVRQVLYEFMYRTDTGYEPFTLSQSKVNQKVRGLVHLVMALPEYSVN